MSCCLPQEILDLVIDHLCNEPGTLKACCVVCKAWVYRTRKHLFNHVKFRRQSRRVSRWRETFPDLLNSPAHNTRTLSLSLTQSIEDPVVETLLTFTNVSSLSLDTSRWDDRRFSLAPLHGLFPIVTSLHLTLANRQSSEAFDFICSTPLLEDLTFAGRFGGNRKDVRTTPSTSPRLTGSLELRFGAGFRYVARQLLDLPNGLRFKSIAVHWRVQEAIASTVNLVSGCSDTLESLLIVNYLRPSEAMTLDLSKAIRLKDIVFLCREHNANWIASGLRTADIGSLQSITLVLTHHSTRVTSVSELYHHGWVDLDNRLIELWNSHSLRLKAMYDNMEGARYLEVDVERLLPESMERGIIDLVKGNYYC